MYLSKRLINLTTLTLASMLVISFHANASSWPDTPLGVTSSAPPMTMIVAGKDHKLFYEAYNDASDIDGDGSLDIRFKPAITYYGLFDSDLCYSYSGDLFSPVSKASGGKCPGKWSGNWLNYITTSRIDALRKVLYGGYREVDTDSDTILRRAYIPQDAHSWAKEYTSPTVDGYNISDFTPLPLPIANHRHFFGNLTPNATTNCATLDTCSDINPVMAYVKDTGKRVWEWASKERTVLDGSHGGALTNYTVRVKVCTEDFHAGCQMYPNGSYKPTGLLHDYGEDDTMLFGLLTGSYNKNMSGGVLRKVVSSFKSEVDAASGQFSTDNTIVQNFDNLRIREFNDGNTSKVYRGRWLDSGPMTEGQFKDWGNPIAEMMYEGLRYFAGKGSPTPAYNTSGGVDEHVGLSVATWDNPYNASSQAKAEWCAKPNMLVMSDINPSFDSDQLPGVYSEFGSFSGDITGLNVLSIANTITAGESDVKGHRFIGQSDGNYDGAPTAKEVASLGKIRGLAPEEPTKEGSYYSASVAYFGKTNDLNTAIEGDQTVDSFFVALASPLPKIEFDINGKNFSIVPFAKTVGKSGNELENFQPTNQIVDFYVDSFANIPGAPSSPGINGGLPYVKFRINFEDVEQGADHDMDAIVDYEIKLNAEGTVDINLDSTYARGSYIHHIGYIVSGSTEDGIYLVVRDKDTDEGSDIDYDLDVPNIAGALPLSSERSFTPGASGAKLLKDPLWYAAKWSGFIDRNDNKTPDLEKEWDANGDGQPDNYFLVQNPLKLEESLQKTLDNIVARTANASNITANSSSISTDSLVFQSLFNTANWSGDIIAYPVTEEGVSKTVTWRASENIPLPASRAIFTTSGGKGTTFKWSNLSTSDQTLIGSKPVLEYLRGNRSEEQENKGDLRDRAENNVLGDIAHSSTVYSKDTNTVFAGSNDGMLHAFHGSTGKELFAYIPSSMYPKLKELADPGYTHDYFVDGEIAVSSQSHTTKNYLVSTLGRGGKGLFGLEVTNPSSFKTSNIAWEYFDSTDNDLGHILGRPVIAKMNNGQWAVIVGNGYDSASDTAALYIFNLKTGALMRKIDTEVAGGNGMATPGIYDEDDDGDIDVIYAGDLKGNLWKFDVSGKSAFTWQSAFGANGKPQPLFVAKDKNGKVQPITAPITMAINDVKDDPHNGKRFVFFGTGSYFKNGDPGNKDVQSLYGLIDEGLKITNRSELKERKVKKEQDTADKTPVRTFEEAVEGDMVGQKGWYLDFSTQHGERITNSALYFKIAVPTLFTTTIIPVVDPCIPGGKGYLNALNPFTGGRTSKGILDVNNDGEFTDDLLDDDFIGGVDLGVGMPGEPVLVGDRLVVSGTNGEIADIKINLGVTPIRGRVFWQEIIKE